MAELGEVLRIFSQNNAGLFSNCTSKLLNKTKRTTNNFFTSSLAISIRYLLKSRSSLSLSRFMWAFRKGRIFKPLLGFITKFRLKSSNMMVFVSLYLPPNFAQSHPSGLQSKRLRETKDVGKKLSRQKTTARGGRLFVTTCAWCESRGAHE